MIFHRILMSGVVMFASMAFFVACSDDAAQFDLAITGEESCYARQFPLKPSFFSLTPTETGVMIRMEREKRVRTETDTAVFMVDTGKKQPSLDDKAFTGQTFNIEPDASASRVYFRFGNSCKSTYTNAQVRGALSFTRFGFEEGDIIEGTLSGTLVDVFTSDTSQGPVTTLTDIGALNATFSFEVHLGPQYSTFTSPPKATRE